MKNPDKELFNKIIGDKIADVFNLYQQGKIDSKDFKLISNELTLQIVIDDDEV